MSHFEKIEDGVVTQVIVAEQDFIDTIDGQWVQTSYNTRGGIHFAPNSSDPDGGIALRKNYAGVDYTYDEGRDAFISPQPFTSWVLNGDTCLWEPPVPKPDDGNPSWDEETQSWL